MIGLDVEAVLAAERCRDIHSDTYTEPWCHACRSWAAHVAAVLRVEIESALGDAMREAEKVVVAFLDAAPCWKAPGERAMVDCAVEDLSADVARLFAEMRGEPMPPPPPNPHRASLAADEGDRQ